MHFDPDSRLELCTLQPGTFQDLDIDPIWGSNTLPSRKTSGDRPPLRRLSWRLHFLEAEKPNKHMIFVDEENHAPRWSDLVRNSEERAR